MSLRQHLSDLQINVRVLESERAFCQDLAFAYLRSTDQALNHESRRMQLAFCATSFRRAGANAILLDDHEQSKLLFTQASKAYLQLGMAYGLMMLVLGDDRPLSNAEFIPHFFDAFSSQRRQDQHWLSRQGPYLLLYLCYEGRSKRHNFADIGGRFEQLSFELQASRSTQIGILGLPVAAYIDLATALLANTVSKVEEALLPFLTAYNASITHGSLNKYHWVRLASPFHPAEPDIVSVLVLVHDCLGNQKLSLLRLVNKLRLSWKSQAILAGILEQKFSKRTGR